MNNFNTIAVNIAAIFFLSSSYTSSAFAEEEYSPYKIDCTKSKLSNVITIRSYIDSATKSKIITSNKSTINIQTSPQSQSTFSFSLDNFPIIIDLYNNNKTSYFIINKACDITENNLNSSSEQDINVNEIEINRDIQEISIVDNELTSYQLELKPYYLSYYPTTLIIPKGYYNDYADSVISLNSLIYLSFEGSYHELITIKQN